MYYVHSPLRACRVGEDAPVYSSSYFSLSSDHNQFTFTTEIHMDALFLTKV